MQRALRGIQHQNALYCSPVRLHRRRNLPFRGVRNVPKRYHVARGKIKYFRLAVPCAKRNFFAVLPSRNISGNSGEKEKRTGDHAAHVIASSCSMTTLSCLAMWTGPTVNPGSGFLWAMSNNRI
jgi:hypothetical protein